MVLAFAAVLGLAVLTVPNYEGMPVLGLLGLVLACYALYFTATASTFHRSIAATTPAHNGAAGSARGTDSQHVDWLLAIRGLAALLVFVMHTGIVLGRDWSWGNAPWAWAVYSPAWLGMVMFFALSGYLMGKGFHRSRYNTDQAGVTAYLRNRWLRIAPLCLVVGVGIVIVQGAGQLGTEELAVRVSTFTYDGMHGPEGIGAFWSLSTEFQFYLAVPLIFVVLRRFLATGGRTRLVAIQVGCLVACSTLRWAIWQGNGGTLDGWNPFVYTPLYCNLDVFLAGFLANWWLDDLGPRPREIAKRTWPLLTIGLILGYSAVAFPAMSKGETGPLVFFAIVLPGLAAVAMIPILLGAEIASQSLTARPRVASVLYWVGALTFPVYLVHSTILRSVQTELGWMPYLIRLGLATALTVAIALVLHLTVEQTVQKWSRLPRPKVPALRLGDAVRADDP